MTLKEYSMDDWLTYGSESVLDDIYTSFSSSNDESSIFHLPSILNQLDTDLVPLLIRHGLEPNPSEQSILAIYLLASKSQNS